MLPDSSVCWHLVHVLYLNCMNWSGQTPAVDDLTLRCICDTGSIHMNLHHNLEQIFYFILLHGLDVHDAGVWTVLNMNALIF